MTSDKTPGKETLCVHAGRERGPAAQGITTPIITSTSFPFPNDEDEVIYPRYFNVATQQAVSEKLAALENGEQGLVLGSGMAAIVSVLLGLLRQGDHAVFHSGIYGGARSFATDRLAHYGIQHSVVTGTSVEDFASEIRENTKLIFFESPTNPLLEVLDIRSIASLGRERGILTVVDNTFATPINQNPLGLGVDVVVHSGTKYLNGHSDVNCGAIVTSSELMESIVACAVDLGGTLDVRGCYLLERGLKTLALRVERQCQNAELLAGFLSHHPRVREVYYPGLETHPGRAVAASQMARFGGMFSFELDAEEEEAKTRLQRLEVATMAISLGGVETLVCFPKETSHAKLSPEARRAAGISDTLVRVSVGVESIDDLRGDFERVLG